MLSKFGVLAGIALAVAVCGGCDDQGSDKQGANADKKTSAMAPARYGAGWHAAAETRQSNWSFALQSPADPALLVAGGDALSGIRTALMSNMLPAHGSVRIEAMVNRS